MELRDRVSLYMVSDDCPKTVNLKDGDTPDDIEKLMTSLVSVFSCVISPSLDKEIIGELDRT